MSITAQIEAAGNEKYVHVEKLENKKKHFNLIFTYE